MAAAAAVVVGILGCTGATEPPPAEPSAPPGSAPAAPTPDTPPAAPPQAGPQLPGYDGRFSANPRLTAEEVAWVPKRELPLLRNEIFARYGRPFQNPELRRHFESKGWYQPVEGFDEAVLTDNDRANSALIQRFEGQQEATGEYSGEGYVYTFTGDVADVWRGDRNDLYNWEPEGSMAYEVRGGFIVVWSGDKGPRTADEVWLLEVDHGERRILSRVRLDPRQG